MQQAPVHSSDSEFDSTTHNDAPARDTMHMSRKEPDPIPKTVDEMILTSADHDQEIWSTVVRKQKRPQNCTKTVQNHTKITSGATIINQSQRLCSGRQILCIQLAVP